MRTDFETLKSLASYTINNLKEKGFIEFEIDHRESLIESMATEFGVSFATDENIVEDAIEDVEDKMGVDNVPEDIIDSEIFNHARKEIIKSYNGESIGGLYLVESLHDVAIRMVNYLIESEYIIDIYGEDENISEFLIKKIHFFSSNKNE